MNKFIHIFFTGTFLALKLTIGAELNCPEQAEQPRNGYLILPVLFYTPETKWAGGAALNYYFRELGSVCTSRPSTIMPSITYTQQKQIMSEVIADLYWRDEAYHILVYIGYKEFPDKFYGIGNATPDSNEEYYTPRSAKISLNIQRKIRSGWNAGIQYELEHNKLVGVDQDGLLIRGDITGSEDGLTSGVGLLINRDTRNNIFFPTSGHYLQLTTGMFCSAIGSDYEFLRSNLDFRKYLSPSASHVIAFQTYMNIITGDPPFQMMSQLGGRIGGYNLMRGYYEGRYRDRDMLAFQIEYRIMPVRWRLGLVAFAGLGDVSDHIEHFKLQNFKYSAGGGIRFLINKKEQLNIRLDFAYGKESSGVYVTIGEAF